MRINRLLENSAAFRYDVWSYLSCKFRPRNPALEEHSNVNNGKDECCRVVFLVQHAGTWGAPLSLFYMALNVPCLDARQA